MSALTSAGERPVAYIPPTKPPSASSRDDITDRNTVFFHPRNHPDVGEAQGTTAFKDEAKLRCVFGVGCGET